MKALHLTFVQRLKVVDLLGQATGSFQKVVVLAAVFDAVRFSDDEFQQIKVSDLGNGRRTFEPPTPEFGVLDTHLEDQQAAALTTELDAFQGFTIQDKEWLSDLSRQLVAPSVKRT